jgi:hypothetical protein
MATRLQKVHQSNRARRNGQHLIHKVVAPHLGEKSLEGCTTKAISTTVQQGLMDEPPFIIPSNYPHFQTFSHLAMEHKGWSISDGGGNCWPQDNKRSRAKTKKTAFSTYYYCSFFYLPSFSQPSRPKKQDWKNPIHIEWALVVPWNFPPFCL